MTPPVVLPADWAGLYKVFANPITFGILISMILSTLKFMAKGSVDKNNIPIPAWKKMLTVIVSCFAWATVITVINPAGFTPDSATAYNVLMLTFAVTFTTQIWHQVVSPLVDQIIQILFGIAANLKARALQLAPHG